MEKKKIWLSSPHIGENELKYVNEAFRTNWIAPVGPHIDKFEELLSDLCDNRYVTALSSGTSAIHLALILLGIKEGDEVLCPSFTFVASANPIVYQGAVPIFVDSELDTWNMCPKELEIAIIDRIKCKSKPKAIILVHLYGMPANLDQIISIGEKYNIPIIEDAAEGIGSTYNGKPLGSFTEFGVYSFNGNKIITTSSGGSIMSSDKEMIDKARFLSTQARDDEPHYEHSEIGYNYRLSNVSAAIGIGQLEILQERVNKRREIFQYYKDHLSDLSEISFTIESKGSFSNRWLSTILISEESQIDREDIRLSLLKENIESRPLWKPMHLQPIFKDCIMYGGKNSEYLFKNGLCLPSGSNMTFSDVDRVINQIRLRFEG